MRIKLQLNSSKKIPVRSVTRTFASGKNERIIFQCLKELGFPYGKVQTTLFSFSLSLALFDIFNCLCRVVS